MNVTGPDALGRWDVAKIANLTTGSTVIMMGGQSTASTVAMVRVLIFVLLTGVGVVVGLASS